MATEEQTQENTAVNQYTDHEEYYGQKLTIANRKVTKLCFRLIRINSPPGNVAFQIRKVSDDSLIVEKTFAASTVPTVWTDIEQTFDSPATINEEVRIVSVYSGGDIDNRIAIRVQSSDVKADELVTHKDNAAAAWVELNWDVYYIYTYTYGWTGKVSGVTNPAKVMGVDIANIAKVKGVA